MPPSTVTVWATNTGVGKTLVSAGLAAVARRGPLYRNVLYIKPVQTGYPDDSDGAHVANVVGRDLAQRAPIRVELLARRRLAA